MAMWIAASDASIHFCVRHTGCRRWPTQMPPQNVAGAPAACQIARMTHEQSNLKAALWMAGSIASFLGMSIAGRATTAELNVFQVLEMRSAIGFIMLLPLVYFAGG